MLLMLFVPVVLAESAPPVVHFALGTSTQGRVIEGVRIGTGPRKLALIGNTHGGPEANTYELVKQLATYFEAHPGNVPSDIRLDIVPTINPDGLALGTRQNANGVDLNRNMDTSADSCPENDWQHVVQGAYGIVSPTGGPYPESEVESRIVRDFLLDANAVVFFHSNAGVVFPACDHQPSITLAKIFADGAHYNFIPKWNKYAITGGMHDWAGGLGIAAITPELVTGDQPEYEQNLGGVEALLKTGNSLLPLPQEHMDGGLPVQPVIWRAWKAWGAQALFGLPLEPPVRTTDGWSQLFERARFEYRPAQSDSTSIVQLALLGRDSIGSATTAVPADPNARFFSETGHNLAAPFADYWQTNGGLPMFGLPLTEAETNAESNPPRLRQVFERGVLEQGPTGHITLLPLGRELWAQRDLHTPTSSVQAR